MSLYVSYYCTQNAKHVPMRYRNSELNCRITDVIGNHKHFVNLVCNLLVLQI